MTILMGVQGQIRIIKHVQTFRAGHPAQPTLSNPHDISHPLHGTPQLVAETTHDIGMSPAMIWVHLKMRYTRYTPK